MTRLWARAVNNGLGALSVSPIIFMILLARTIVTQTRHGKHRRHEQHGTYLPTTLLSSVVVVGCWLLFNVAVKRSRFSRKNRPGQFYVLLN